MEGGEMTDEQINIAIAESLGWKLLANNRWTRPCGFYADLPNYTADLNAMHEAEALIIKLGHRAIRTYEDLLQKQIANIVFATARQRCEAYLRTLGRWIE